MDTPFVIVERVAARLLALLALSPRFFTRCCSRPVFIHVEVCAFRFETVDSRIMHGRLMVRKFLENMQRARMVESVAAERGASFVLGFPESRDSRVELKQCVREGRSERYKRKQGAFVREG